MQGFSGRHAAGEEVAEELPRWRRVIPVTLGLAIAVALGLLFVLADRAADERDDALTLQRHSYEVVALARNAQGAAAHAESLLARYVVSLEADDGRRYTDEWRLTGRLIENLRRVTRDNPVQARHMVALQAAYRERGATLNDIALRTTYDQRVGALGHLYAANKLASADRINRVLEQVIEHEIALLGRRSSAVSRSETRVDAVAGSYTLAGVVLFVAALIALWVANGAFNEWHYARRLAQSEARRVDGLEVAVAERTVALEDANVRLRTEMAERAQIEESLRQMHKMEAVGQLTGGIAHDFNNMLAVVIGGLELAKRRLDPGSDAQRHIDNAMEGANRAASLTRRLLAFARAEPLLPTSVDPDQLIRDMAELIDRTIGDQIAVKMDAGAGDWRLWADRHQLENTLLNLCVNARDAMEGSGTLTIATGQAMLRPGEIGDCAGGDYVLLSVKDSGHGMTPEVLARVFEPFFTTKPVGKGTGLGLSQVFGYVRQCKGEITILSTPGEGTEVRLFLPRDRRAEGMAGQRAHAREAQAPQAPRRRILVVEDDPRVLAATLAALQELGHETVSCDEPANAASVLADHPETELILTDVLMPGLTGPEMVAGLRAGGVKLPVIYVTGFGGEDADSGMLDNQHVLRKPFTLAQLDRIIASIDEGAPAFSA